MNICFFGSYNQHYSRNKILIDGLDQNGVTIYHCHSASGSIFQRYPQLILRYLKIINNIDVIYVAFVGQYDMPLAWLLARLTGKCLIFDMFYSMYDTYVFDRKSFPSSSFTAKRYFLIDKIAATLADIVIVDTITHGKYFQQLLQLPSTKFRRVFVGADSSIFKPIKRKSNKVIIQMHGNFSRLQGVEYFIKTAKYFMRNKKIVFRLIGDNRRYIIPTQLLDRLKLPNLIYQHELPEHKLAQFCAESTIIVGHLGITKKAQSVISNKTYQGIACKVATIVQDSLANRELFTDRENVLFTKPGNPRDLANIIRLLLTNSKLRKKVATSGNDLYNEQLTPKEIGKLFLKQISSCL